MCRGPLPYGHAGATRIFSDSACSFAVRRRAKDHTNEYEEHRERRSGRSRRRERKRARAVVHDDGDGNVDVTARGGGVRDRVAGRPVSSTRRRLTGTSDAGWVTDGARRTGRTDRESPRRRHGCADRGGREDEPAGVGDSGRCSDDERRFGGRRRRCGRRPCRGSRTRGRSRRSRHCCCRNGGLSRRRRRRRSGRWRDRSSDGSSRSRRSCGSTRSRLGRRRGRLGRDRSRRRRRSGRRRRRGGRRRQEGERVEVALLVRGRANAEMHVRPCLLGRSGRADRPDPIALGHHRALRHRERAEVREGDREPVGGQDRDALPARGHDPGERHLTAGGRNDGRPGRRADVDPAVLARGIRMRRVEREPGQDRPGGGPGPRPRRRHDDDEQHHDDRERPHDDSLLLSDLPT